MSVFTGCWRNFLARFFYTIRELQHLASACQIVVAVATSVRWKYTRGFTVLGLKHALALKRQFPFDSMPIKWLSELFSDANPCSFILWRNFSARFCILAWETLRSSGARLMYRSLNIERCIWLVLSWPNTCRTWLKCTCLHQRLVFRLYIELVSNIYASL